MRYQREGAVSRTSLASGLSGSGPTRSRRSASTRRSADGGGIGCCQDFHAPHLGATHARSTRRILWARAHFSQPTPGGVRQGGTRGDDPRVPPRIHPNRESPSAVLIRPGRARPDLPGLLRTARESPSINGLLIPLLQIVEMGVERQRAVGPDRRPLWWSTGRSRHWGSVTSSSSVRLPMQCTSALRRALRGIG